jgi:hypothetical protein
MLQAGSGANPASYLLDAGVKRIKYVGDPWPSFNIGINEIYLRPCPLVDLMMWCLDQGGS